jgi:dihydropteroate synthase
VEKLMQGKLPGVSFEELKFTHIWRGIDYEDASEKEKHFQMLRRSGIYSHNDSRGHIVAFDDAMMAEIQEDDFWQSITVPEATEFAAREHRFSLKRPVIMGILNVTPDSFSDGGKYNQVGAAVARAKTMIQDGADIIDIGGESSRPGAMSVTVSEEINRILPVIKALSGEVECISIDTVKPEVAEAALDAGAAIINDISGLHQAPEMADIAARYNAGYILMHMKGTPRTMQIEPEYQHLLDEVLLWLKEGLDTALESGLSRENLIVDPGIGFGKSLEHNLVLIQQMQAFRSLGTAVMLGASRKSFIQKLTGADATQRLGGSIAALLSGWHNGAHIFRVHDVFESRQALELAFAIREATL